MYASGSFSSQSQPGYYLYHNIIAPLLTSWGNPWLFVEDYAASPTSGSTYSVWRSQQAYNTSGMDWYLIFVYQTASQAAGSTTFSIYVCEVYNTTGHTWNRVAIAYQGSGNFYPGGAYSSTIFDSSNGRAYTAASPNVVGTPYNSIGGLTAINQSFSSYGVSSSLTSYQIVGNADGFFLCTLVGASSYAAYHGSFSTLINPAVVADTKTLVTCGTSVQGKSFLSYTRDPLADGSSQLAPYSPRLSAGLIAYTLSAGTVNQLPIDAFQNGLWAARLAIWEYTDSTTPGGIYRGLLPAWILTINAAAGVVFGDTITVTPGPINGASGDVFVYPNDAISPFKWIDTAA